ncbi:hypothetical protein BJX61DRAFT_87429 [Aspergillus egyptiacus]|nr:hypothetical protein BJX61DRAFT_87429 [Aspergillus egyptiacus]
MYDFIAAFFHADSFLMQLFFFFWTPECLSDWPKFLSICNGVKFHWHMFLSTTPVPISLFLYLSIVISLLTINPRIPDACSIRFIPLPPPPPFCTGTCPCEI